VYPGTAHFLGRIYPLLSQELVKLRTSNFVCIFTGSIGLLEQKSIKNVGKSSCGRRQGLSKIFRAAIYRVHRAVVFAIAQLSCWVSCVVKVFQVTIFF